MAMVTWSTNGSAMGTAAIKMERAVSKVPLKSSGFCRKNHGPTGKGNLGGGLEADLEVLVFLLFFKKLRGVGGVGWGG